MDELRELYQEVILDHGKNPRNKRRLDPADLEADGYNPLCGDKLKLFLKLDGDRIEDVSFEGCGCAISVASASMLTEVLPGKTRAEARALVRRFTAMATAPTDQEPETDGLGKLAVFAGVREFPMRVKCATLCWHALEQALDETGQTARTEDGP